MLWKLPGTSIFRNVKQGESPGQFVKGVLVLRVGASMYFANVAYIKETILKLCGEFGEGDPTPVSIAREMVATGDAAEDDGSAAALVLQAARPWSRDTHHLFPVADRARAVELLIWGHRLAREQWFDARFPAMALLDVWVGSVIPHAVSRDTR